ncbi:uncharacterized protein EV154DRAFT_476545 [Mucor mucedo]|uniref:uncharacterized protein n=1 Tax=Mucor mucedo TaxID=29922 RepID=UPI00221F503C|nr:uncharacterized protein EV154DRAFT_476545 [Mucor mucedo]KAI7896176.1 hypothetical protein EV154DRAFT_476545 [Mucor mucedo]
MEDDLSSSEDFSEGSISTDLSEERIPGEDINFVIDDLRLRLQNPPDWFGTHDLTGELIREFRRAGLFDDEIEALEIKFYQTERFKLRVRRLNMLDTILGYVLVIAFVLFFELHKGSSRYLYISNKF